MRHSEILRDTRLFRIVQSYELHRLVYHNHQAPELRRCVSQGLGSAWNDAVPKGDNPGQRVLTLPAAPDPLDRGASLVPGGVHRLEGEQAFR